MLMGGWFVATALGGYTSGALGTLWGTMPHSQFFMVVAGVVLGAAALLVLVLRFLRPVFARALAE